MQFLSKTLVLLYIVAGVSGDDSNLTNFEFIGREHILQYDEFGGLPEGICSTLQTLNLEYAQFKANTLIESLKECKQLRNITLSKVEFMGSISGKVALPKLKTFNLILHQIQAESADEFMAYLFFFDPQIHDVVPSTVDIQIWSRTNAGSLEYNSTTSRLLLSDISNYDLTQYFHYNELSLYSSFLDHKVLKLSNLTSLYLYTNKYFNDVLLQVLKSAVCLVHLQVDLGWSKPIQSLTVDLSIFPAIEDFRTLRLDYAKVGTTKPIKLQRLGELGLWQSELDTSLIIISKSVYYLNLYNVTFIRNNLDSFISERDNLTQVYLYYPQYPHANFNIASFVNTSHKVETLYLTGLRLNFKTSAKVHFQSLRELSFSDCEFEENMESTLIETFQNVTNLYISKTSISYGAFQGLLNSTTEVLYYTRNDVEIPEIDQFLLEFGVPSYIPDPKLERSNKTTTGWLYSHPDNLKNRRLRNVILYTYVVLLLTVSGIGILGNVLNGIVLTRKNMRSSTSCILLGLTICDTVILITYVCSMFYFGIKLILVFIGFSLSFYSGDNHLFGVEVNGDSIKRLDNLQYSLLYPLNKTAYTGSVYTTILLTIERYLAVCWPLSVRRILKMKTAIYSTLLLLVFAVILNFPRWVEAQQYYSVVYTYSTDYKVSPNVKNLHFTRSTAGTGLLRNHLYRQYYHGWIWVTVMYIIPICGLCFLNFKIWTQLKRSKQNRDTMTSTTRQNREEEEMASLTKMLLCIILIFVVCNSVSGVIVWALISYDRWDPSDTEVFSCIPLIINSSINFLIYTFLGSKFRAELGRLITSWCRIICRIEVGSRSPEPRIDISLRTMNSST